MSNNTEILYSYLIDKLNDSNITNNLIDIRKEALQLIKRYGIPTKNNEQWKYVNAAQILNNIIENTNTEENKIPQEKNIDFNIDPANTIFITNGQLNSNLSSKINGITINENDSTTLKQALEDKSDFINILNEASLNYTTSINIDTKLENPLYIVNLFDNSEKLISYKINVNVNEGDNNTITEIFLDNSLRKRIITYALEVKLAKNTKLNNHRFNNIKSPLTFLNTTTCTIKRDAEFNHTNISLSETELTKNHIECYLDEENASTNLYGLHFLKGNQINDNQTAVFHNVSNCTSNELYKYVNSDSATGIFNGKIFVAQDAQQTQAFQQNKNILLSTNAIIHSRPQLEIFANDVKCSHGCTIGQLDESSIFYLKTRGIAEEEAKRILIEAFFLDVVNQINIDDLRNYIYNKLNTSL